MRERIRAEAIERIARALFEADAADMGSSDPYEDWAARYRRRAEPFVDALGDMLPVDEQWRVAQQISPRVKDCVAAFSRDEAHRYASRSGGTPERRYLGAWTEATE
jgi:hypothetical protein